jgi:hypothetical protein
MEPRANRLRAGAGRFIATISGSSIEEETCSPPAPSWSPNQRADPILAP